MCFGIPMRVVQVKGFTARCEAKDLSRDVNLFLLAGEPIAVGDYVTVHLGSAIRKMTEQEARTAWEIYDEMLAVEDLATKG